MLEQRLQAKDVEYQQAASELQKSREELEAAIHRHEEETNALTARHQQELDRIKAEYDALQTINTERY
jgi:cytochrome c556